MSDPSINFGLGKKVEYKNNNAIKGDAFKTPEGTSEKDATIWQNKQALFKQFDTNGDNILDTSEIKNLQSYLNKAAGKNVSQKEMDFIAHNLSIQAQRAGNEELANQLKNLSKDDLYNFTKQIAENTDTSVQTEWEGNTLTVKENGTTTVSEYSDNAHSVLAKQFIKTDNEEKTTIYGENNNPTEIHIKRPSSKNPMEIIDTKYNDDNTGETQIIRNNPNGLSEVTLNHFTIKDNKEVLTKSTVVGFDDIKTTTEFLEDGKTPAKVEIENGKREKTTRVYAEDRSYTETAPDGTVTKYDKDGKKIEDSAAAAPQQIKYKVQNGENWYKIVQQEYGVTDHKQTMELVHQLKDLHGKDKYGSDVNYNSASVPKELTLPANIELKNGTKIQLKNMPAASEQPAKAADQPVGEPITQSTPKPATVTMPKPTPTPTPASGTEDEVSTVLRTEIPAEFAVRGPEGELVTTQPQEIKQNDNDVKGDTDVVQNDAAKTVTSEQTTSNQHVEPTQVKKEQDVENKQVQSKIPPQPETVSGNELVVVKAGTEVIKKEGNKIVKSPEYAGKTVKCGNEEIVFDKAGYPTNRKVYNAQQKVAREECFEYKSFNGWVNVNGRDIDMPPTFQGVTARDYTYDDAGNKTKMVKTNKDGEQVLELQYDATGKMTKVKGEIELSADAARRKEQMQEYLQALGPKESFTHYEDATLHGAAGGYTVTYSRNADGILTVSTKDVKLVFDKKDDKIVSKEIAHTTVKDGKAMESIPVLGNNEHAPGSYSRYAQLTNALDNDKNFGNFIYNNKFYYESTEFKDKNGKIILSIDANGNCYDKNGTKVPNNTARNILKHNNRFNNIATFDSTYKAVPSFMNEDVSWMADGII